MFALTASLERLRAFDQDKDREIEELWTDFRTPVDHDQLERESHAALGPEGLAYLRGLTREDYTPFNVTGEIERSTKSAD